MLGRAIRHCSHGGQQSLGAAVAPGLSRGGSVKQTLVLSPEAEAVGARQQIPGNPLDSATPFSHFTGGETKVENVEVTCLE